jgi:GYF domain 2
VADQWYYACDGQQWGPVSSASLREMAVHGVLQPTDLVWTEGMSQWAPASLARGLFPSRAPVPAPKRSPGPALLAPDEGKEPWHDQPQGELAEAHPIPGLHHGSDLQRAPGRAVLIGGLVAILGLAFLVAIAAVAKVADPGVNRSYSINLNFEGQVDSRPLHFRQNERVHITVTTHEWSGLLEPDVDLYVIDPDGNELIKDDRPFKDCDVSFVAPQTGNYEIVVVLDSGSGVRCTVRY